MAPTLEYFSKINHKIQQTTEYTLADLTFTNASNIATSNPITVVGPVSGILVSVVTDKTATLGIQDVQASTDLGIAITTNTANTVSGTYSLVNNGTGTFASGITAALGSGGVAVDTYTVAVVVAGGSGTGTWSVTPASTGITSSPIPVSVSANTTAIPGLSVTIPTTASYGGMAVTIQTFGQLAVGNFSLVGIPLNQIVITVNGSSAQPTVQQAFVRIRKKVR